MLLPLILLYMLSLVLAAWPSEIRPEAMDRISTFPHRVLETVGIRAGMPVFVGQEEKMAEVIVGRCIFVDGIDSDGTTTRLYPGHACPPEGFRWKPVIFDHFLLHWSWNVTPRVESPDLLAMGDFFCHASPERSLTHVEITRLTRYRDYETGRETRYSELLGYIPCRP